MKTIGETLKYIRKSKNLTQKEVYTNIISRASYQNFESNKQTPSISVLNQLLNVLGMSKEEFFFVQNNKRLNARGELKYLYDQINTSLEEDKITNLIKKNYAYLANNNNDYEIQHLTKCLEALTILQKKDDFKKAKEVVSYIWQEKMKQDELYLTDIKILASIFYIFPEETALNIAKRINKELKTYQKFENTIRLQISILLNTSSFLLMHNKIKEAELFVNDVLHLAKDNKYYLQWAVAIGKKGIIQFLLNKKEYKQNIEKCSKLLEYMDEPLQLEDFKTELNKYHIPLPKIQK
ncbi:helix-turn-helix transcriptional regulator [Listeria sp. FSL L7-1509]|uniref:Helix-turn-helix transcriptional regulator n=1 Tax=Listeria immobilis TaxID=2713502 RepID=A0ABR6T010_9LIST|nr:MULTISPECIES: helix-turn-helix transcriptional regulator [Listeria]MBC1484583.1 helix-turn-helix transcriptional regulator [Listeria immobilis]MBC1508273.1 helix-turn-helix transcriptional regulator [Listeria immobilis]MBC1511278.1 helix-turn-helix transcriptional regulator [Listeria immobilis]MBC1839526.1 helix-turn-helix transcriptional regulator [Listeria seeligeri]MBC6313684.1 helix-turn-helix transcriptional regulator [Listeria immobilis]